MFSTPQPSTSAFWSTFHRLRYRRSSPTRIVVKIDGVISFDLNHPDSKDGDLTYVICADGSYRCPAFYYGSGTRVGDHATVWDQTNGFHSKKISVFFGDPYSNESRTLRSIGEVEISRDQWPTRWELGDFSSYEVSLVDGMKLTLNFRSLHRFGDDIEISAVTITPAAAINPSVMF
jgi:hypothetical protein